MIKVFLFDADGMVIKPHGYFSDYYAESFGVPLAKISPFFKNEFQQCLIGQAEKKMKELG